MHGESWGVAVVLVVVAVVSGWGVLGVGEG